MIIHHCPVSYSTFLRYTTNFLLFLVAGAEIILVVYHLAGVDSKKKDPQTDSLDLQHNNICLVVDVFYSKNNGLYRCEQNDRAMSRIYRLFGILC